MRVTLCCEEPGSWGSTNNSEKSHAWKWHWHFTKRSLLPKALLIPSYVKINLKPAICHAARMAPTFHPHPDNPRKLLSINHQKTITFSRTSLCLQSVPAITKKINNRQFNRKITIFIYKEETFPTKLLISFLTNTYLGRQPSDKHKRYQEENYGPLIQKIFHHWVSNTDNPHWRSHGENHKTGNSSTKSEIFRTASSTTAFCDLDLTHDGDKYTEVPGRVSESQPTTGKTSGDHNVTKKAGYKTDKLLSPAGSSLAGLFSQKRTDTKAATKQKKSDINDAISLLYFSRDSINDAEPTDGKSNRPQSIHAAWNYSHKHGTMVSSIHHYSTKFFISISPYAQY